MQQWIENYMVFLGAFRGVSDNTLAAYRRDLEHWKHSMELKGKLLVTEITSVDMTRYLYGLETEGKSPATIARMISSLRGFFLYLIKHGVLREDPTENLKLPKVEPTVRDILSAEEVARLLAAPRTDTPGGSRDAVMLTLLYATGVRVTELLALDVADINMDVRALHCSLTGKERVVPFSKEAEDLLRLYLSENRDSLEPKDDALFVNRRGERLSRQGFWKILQKYVKDAQIETPVTPQVIRNSFAVHMTEHGADLKSLQEMLGHANLTTTSAYINKRSQRLKEVYDRAQSNMKE